MSDTAVPAVPRSAEASTRSAALLADLSRPEVVAVRHPGRMVGILIAVVLATMLVHTVIVNPHFQWAIVWQYFTDDKILTGVVLTMKLTVITLAVAFVLGTVLAVARTSGSTFLDLLSWSFIWFFRGTPLLVQLIFWYNLAALYPRLSLGIPFGPEFVHGDANHTVTAFSAALIALGLNQSAYMGEIIRAGLLAVDEGQKEAASVLGFTPRQVLWKIVAPQAMRVIIPSAGNLLIGLLKYTSIVSVIALPDLLYSAQLIYAQDFLVIPILLSATAWYLIITTALTVLQYYVERHYSRGASRNLPLTPWQKAKRLRAQLHKGTAAVRA